MRIDPRNVRYIKLGRGGVWAERSLNSGEVHFGYKTIPHELCMAGNWDAVAAYMVEHDGRSPGKAKDMTREIRDFYTLGDDCLWITFADGHLYRAFANPDVSWLGHEEDGQGARSRKTVDGWHRSNVQGDPLRFDTLNTRLTRVAAYRQTICSVKAQDYLLRRINGVEEPVVARARAARDVTIAAASEMIAGLHWADFETLVDLIFARSGWQRVSRVGGAQADVDLILSQPATGETAFVQVKSAATQAVLDDYVTRFKRSQLYDLMFFVCHSPKTKLDVKGDKALYLWLGDQLADKAVAAGLYDWLIERTV